MRSRIDLSRWFLAQLFVVLSCGFAAFSNAAATLPDVSPEGLRLVPGTHMAAVYRRDDADFSGYTKVALLDCYVAFRKDWQRDQNRSTPASRVTDQDIVRIKTELAEQLKVAFTRELNKKGTAVTTDISSDVLIVRPAIINLDIAAPDTMEPGVRSFSTSAGQMTLYLEVFDGVSGELLARVIDPQKATDYGRMRVRNSVTNHADADRILKLWAERLANYLERARSGAAK
jgi:hypothetical protein